MIVKVQASLNVTGRILVYSKDRDHTWEGNKSADWQCGPRNEAVTSDWLANKRSFIAGFKAAQCRAPSWPSEEVLLQLADKHGVSGGLFSLLEELKARTGG